MKSFRLIILMGLTAALLFFSCNMGGDDSGGEQIPAPNISPETAVSVLPTSPYLDITEKTIYNTTIHLEYSRDGGTSWQQCSGAEQYIAGLSVGDHVLVRDSERSITRDLGTVLALEGAPDFQTDNRIYIGFGENNTWEDYATGNPGQQAHILSYMMNLGDEIAQTYSFEFYLSGDNLINPQEDYLIAAIDPYSYATPAGDVYVSNNDSFTITIPNVPAGMYYIGMVADSNNSIVELNDGNNITSPENCAEILIGNEAALQDGAFKMVNSWGTGDLTDQGYLNWQNITSDGHYWMPYEVMKANRMPVFFYLPDLSAPANPTARTVFQITAANRGLVQVDFGLVDPSAPDPGNTSFSDYIVTEKPFDSRFNGVSQGGAVPFPNNEMAMDITEMAYGLGDYNLFMRISNRSTQNAILDSYSLEYMLQNSSPQSLAGIAGIEVGPSETEIIIIQTSTELSQSALEAITPSEPIFRSAIDSNQFVYELPGIAERQSDMQAIGVFREGFNYNQQYGPHGTGFIPPTLEEWSSLMKLRSIDYPNNRSSFQNVQLPDNVDLSQTQYFPPIGDQGGKGSCSAFSVAYYMQSYYEAKRNNWDLSTMTWIDGNDGTSYWGHPSDPSKIFSVDFLYHQVNGGVDEGSFTISVIETLLRQGCPTWQTAPYIDSWDANPDTPRVPSDYQTWPGVDAWKEAPFYRPGNTGNFYFEELNSGYLIVEDDHDIQILKGLLNQGYLISASIHTESVYFENLDSNDVVKSSVNWYQNGLQVDHAQTIVGYKEGSAWNRSNPDA